MAPKLSCHWLRVLASAAVALMVAWQPSAVAAQTAPSTPTASGANAQATPQAPGQSASTPTTSAPQGAQQTATATPTPAVPRTVLAQHQVPNLSRALPLHPTDPAKQLDLSIALQPRNPAQLAALAAQLRDPHQAARARHFLTPAEFATRFAPTQPDVDAVVAYLATHGLQVRNVSTNHLLIQATGSVASVQSAFEIQLQDFTLKGRTVHAPQGDPSVPAALASVVHSVIGLSNAAVPRPHLQKATTRPQAGSGPGGGYTPAEFRTAYDVTSLPGGSGQNVALVEFDTYNPGDIAEFTSRYGSSPPNLVVHSVDGGVSNPGAGAAEADLDIEALAGLAPGATQHIYVAPNYGTAEIDLYNQIVSDKLATIVSTSWGDCEQDRSPAEITTLDAIFNAGVVEGMTFFAAAGDSGAYDCAENGDPSSLAVDFPASDPSVVAVGGTRLTTGSGGSYQSESVWNNGNGWATGGGLSTLFPLPAYQEGSGVRNGFSNGMREVPDVSADADPNTGAAVYCTVAAAGCDPSFGWASLGGTSLASPLWAGMLADIDQYLSSQGKSTVANTHTSLYQSFNTTQTLSPYHDITTGNNAAYAATAGYDLASGVGSPDAFNLARDLAGVTVSPVVTGLPAPARVADTRALGGPIPTGNSRCFIVAGVDGIPADASAVVMTLTAVGQSANGWLTAYPDGQPVPTTSSLNFAASEYAVANGVIMRAGTGGQVCVAVGTVNSVPGSAQVILDATGYIPAAATSELTMLAAPVRVSDTRSAGGAVPTGGATCFQVAGTNGIPADAAAAVLNVTAAGYSTNGWLAVYPGGEAVPSTSTVDFGPSEYAMANNTIMRIGNAGQVCVAVGTVNSAPGGAQVVVDAAGYVTSAGLGSVQMLSGPQRVVDTRTSGGPVPSGASRCFTVAGAAGVPANATGVIVNVTAAGYTAPGWLTAYPSGGNPPSTSTLNFDPTQFAVADGAIVRAGTGGQVCVSVGTVNSAPGSSHIILDVVGYLLG